MCLPLPDGCALPASGHERNASSTRAQPQHRPRLGRAGDGTARLACAVGQRFDQDAVAAGLVTIGQIKRIFETGAQHAAEFGMWPMPSSCMRTCTCMMEAPALNASRACAASHIFIPHPRSHINVWQLARLTAKITACHQRTSIGTRQRTPRIKRNIMFRSAMRKRRSLIRTASLPAISVTVNRRNGSTASAKCMVVC